MLIDLHSHSYYSDGIFSPTEVVKMAKNSNCDAFALTDHDSIEGFVEAQTAAKEVGLNLITGVEISALWNNMTIHIVALNFDENNLEIKNLLQKHQNLRKDRAVKMGRGLEAAGVKDAMIKTQNLVQKNMITRTHFARMLIESGYCKDMSSVFKRYLTGKKPGGINCKWLDLSIVIDIIKQSGGLAIIAHPLRYRMTNTKIKRLFAEFKNLGGDGVEVITGSSTFDNIDLVLKWSEEFGLMQSSGSDFHGDNDYIKIGKLKNINLPNPIWRKFC